MPADHLVRYLQKAAIGTIRACDSWLFTHAANTFIGAGWRITGFPGFSALETPGIYILSAPKKRSKQLYLGGGRRIVCDGDVWWIRRDRFRHQRQHSVARGFVDRFHTATII